MLITIPEVYSQLRAVLSARPHFQLRELAAPDPTTGERILHVIDDPANYPRPSMAASASFALRWVERNVLTGVGSVQIRLFDPSGYHQTKRWRRYPPPFEEIVELLDEWFTAFRATAQQREALDRAEAEELERLKELTTRLGPKSLRVIRRTAGHLRLEVILRPKTIQGVEAIMALLTHEERLTVKPIYWVRVYGLTTARLEELLAAGQPHLRDPIANRFTRARTPGTHQRRR